MEPADFESKIICSIKAFFRFFSAVQKLQMAVT